MRKWLSLVLLITLSLAVSPQASAAPFKIAKGLFGNYSHRFRFVSWDRAIGLQTDDGSAATFTRQRTSFDLTYTPVYQASLYLKLTNEFRYYFQPQGRDFTLNEVFFDNLYINLRGFFNDKLSLSIGRQNLKYGSGFIVMDASPLDGSRSGYFNALSFKWNIANGRKLDGFFISINETDDFLPVIHDQEVMLVEQPERGYGLYFTNYINKNFCLEGYWIGKEVCFDCDDSAQSSIQTVGTRIMGQIKGDLSGVLEVAVQFGDRGNQDRSAFGGYGQLAYSTRFGRRWLPYIDWKGGVIYLSGDNRDTEKYEGWDPMFGRWPQWSESYIYTFIRENGVAWWSNLVSLYLSAKISTGTNANLTLTYHRLMAQEKQSYGSFPGGEGTTRGDLFIAKYRFKIDDHCDGHVLWEHFEPGDFYFDGAESYNWLRMELNFTR
jgi:hypothetical protein